MNKKLYSVGYSKENGLSILNYDITNKFYDNGWYYVINRETKDGYAICRISEHDMAYFTFSFSPKCALLKHIMNLNNDIIELGEKLGNNYVEIIYSQIHQAKKELEKYL